MLGVINESFGAIIIIFTFKSDHPFRYFYRTAKINHLVCRQINFHARCVLTIWVVDQHNGRQNQINLNFSNHQLNAWQVDKYLGLL